MNKKWINLFRRSFQEASIQIWRNKFLSGTTILLGALILFLLNFVYSVNFFADYSLKDLESRADFSVPLEENYDAFTFDSLKNDLKNNFDLEISFLQPQAFENFSVPARLHIKFKKLSEVKEVFQTLKKIRYDEVIGVWDNSAEVDFVNIIDKLLMIRSTVEKVSFWLLILFISGGVLLVINTFRIVIFSRRTEISIARLVGADTKFIAFPFLIEGFLLGLFASLVSIFTFVFVLRELDVLPRGLIFLYFWEHIFSYEIFISGLIGVLGAWISIKKYLYSKLDKMM